MFPSTHPRSFNSLRRATISNGRRIAPSISRTALRSAVAFSFVFLFSLGMLLVLERSTAPQIATASFAGDQVIGREQLWPIVMAASKEHDVDAELLWAVISVESNFDYRAESGVGAMGLMQLMPDTAREMNVIDPFNPDQNIRGGAKYLRQMLKRFKGNYRLALAAYNAGPENVRRYRGIPPYRETRNYVTKVLREYQANLKNSPAVSM